MKTNRDAFFQAKISSQSDARHNGTAKAGSVNSKACYSSKIEELMFQFMITENSLWFLGHDCGVGILENEQVVFG